jgi:hypothetical protein
VRSHQKRTPNENTSAWEVPGYVRGREEPEGQEEQEGKRDKRNKEEQENRRNRRNKERGEGKSFERGGKTYRVG